MNEEKNNNQQEVEEQQTNDLDTEACKKGEKKDKKGKCRRRPRIDTSMIARVGIFSAAAFVIYVFFARVVPLNIFASLGAPWLELHFDEIPMLIAGFAYGPLVGFLVVLIKTILSLPLGVLPIGALADFIMSSAMVVSAAWIYRNDRTLKGAITALVISSVVQMAVALACNMYFLVDTYIAIFEIEIFSESFPRHTYYELLFPFNLIKNTIVGVLTFLTYKSTHRMMERIQIGRKAA